MDTQALLARIAQLETELARRPDPASVAREITNNPTGAFQKYGVPTDHVTRVLVATALGDQAPPEMKALAMMGPQVTATQAIQAENLALRQRLEALEQKLIQEPAARQSFQTVASDKAKYPLLAATLAKAPDLFKDEVAGHRGDAAALAANLETRLKLIAQATGATTPASSANADNRQGAEAQLSTSQQDTAQMGGAMGGDPPPIPGKPADGLLDDGGLKALRDEIVRKAASGAYETRQ